jgi:hypothetical protein
LPHAPVVQLSAAPQSASLSVLAAATYGRGVWQIPLWTAGTLLTTATVSPGPLTFGTQTLGTTSSPQTLTVTNTGGIALAVSSIAVTGDFGETHSTCTNASLNAGDSCTIQVTFTPAQIGDRPGQLVISANVQGGPIAVSLDGTGIGTGVVSLTPGSLGFGQVAVASTSNALPVTVENAGSTPLAVTSLTATAPFAIATNACGNMLAANSDCQLTMVFKPTQAGDANGTLTLISAAGTQTVALTGTGAVAATDGLSPSSLAFPATATGQLSAAQNVVLTNDGDLSLNLITASATAEYQTSNNCGGSLAGHASCSISVVFAPTQVGSQSGTLSVSDALKTQTVVLSGTGLQPPALNVNPSQLSFTAQTVGVPSMPVTLTVSNTGGVQMANVGFQITGAGANSFSIGSTTCGATLAAGSNCTVQLTFTPAVAGTNSATLIVSSSTIGVAAVQVVLNGVGQWASGLSVSPSQMVFTQPTLGQASASQIATITNPSSVAAGGLTFAVTGPFSLTQNGCGNSLAAQASCTAGIAFTPVANGTAAGSLTVSSTSFASPARVSLSGTGGAAGTAQIQPGVLSFGTTGVGATSATQTVTITNTGSVAFADLGVSVTSGFQLAATTCTASLAPGAACTATVAFAPTSAGQQNGSLTVSSSLLAASVQAPLSGMGFDFTAGLTGGSSQTVSSGQTARYTLTLSPMNGSSGTFTFQCDTLPQHAGCTFNPTSAAVAANVTGSATVQIATGQATASSQITAPHLGGKWRALPVALGLVVLPIAWRKRRKVLLLCAVLACLASGVASCSGGGGGNGGTTPPPSQGSNNTPPGSYVVGVTATANGVSHKVTLSLIVD